MRSENAKKKSGPAKCLYPIFPVVQETLNDPLIEAVLVGLSLVNLNDHFLHRRSLTCQMPPIRGLLKLSIAGW